MNSFDIAEYAKAMKDFFEKIGNAADVTCEIMTSTLTRVCKCLRIAEIKLLNFNGSDSVIYSDTNADYSKYIAKTSISTDTEYKIYKKADGEDWTETEYSMAEVFFEALISSIDNITTRGMIDSLEYYDYEFRIHNMRYFSKFVDEIIKKGEIGNYTACYFNLQNFAMINQQIGRARGTEVMREYIHRLEGFLGPNEAVCRVGGADFALLFLDNHTENVIEHLKGAGILYDDENRIWITSCAGYYKIPADCKSTDDILDCINNAIFIAQNIMKTSYVFLDEQLMKNQNDAKRIEEMFLSAIENKEFQAYYQPKVRINEYKLAGAEALCRWFHDGEMMAPYRFIPVLEQSKAICTLDFYMLDRVCSDIRRWLDEGREVVKTSVNLSRRHMDNPELLNDILEIIDRNNVPHKYIEIELTETTTDVDFKDLKRIVFGLKENGISTSVDDFGVGYSSLNLIRELPWNVLKIDRSFLPMGERKNAQQKIMLKHIISMAQDMGLECIVEGVETPEHIRLLKECKCYLAQGYYFDKPLPVDEFEKRMD